MPMTPKKVFFVEDNAYYRRAGEALLAAYGHEIVAGAKTLEEALELVPKLAHLGVQVAVIDGNLTQSGRDGKDGERINNEIRRLHPDIIVVGWSTDIYGWPHKMECLKSFEAEGKANSLGLTVANL